ncbi:MAG TPA: glycosyltransferase family 4 protein [Nitrospiria bacterium]|nr:glycosyltransferase family 4 protein [Nitrospiria bacterium]
MAKINICHIVSGDLWAGAEAQAYALIKGLSKKESLNLSAITFNPGRLTHKIMESGIPVNVVDENKFNMLRMIVVIYGFLRKNHIDIIHTHGYKETLLGGLAARFSRARGIVRTHHGKGVVNGVLRHRLIEKMNSVFFSDELIAVSDDLMRFLITKGYRKDKITVIHNGILSEEVKPDVSADDLKDELKIEPGAFVIGTLGRMVAVKGHGHFLEGAKRVLEKYENVFFVIVGDGPLMEETQQEVKRIGIETKTRLTGFRSDPFNLIYMFDVFTLTSLDEGIPSVLLEAMCLSKPIIATKVGGIPEIVSDRWNGLLIAPMDAQEFASACIELLEDGALRDKLSVNARKDFISKYDIERVTDDVEKVYTRFL